MSDRLLNDLPDQILNQREQQLESEKNTAIAKYNKELKIIIETIYHINKYIIFFGRESNVFAQLKDVKAELENNKKHLENWINMI
tara:strand:- start:155 stop:409 length:255 start_codon:yes stop_codon:yes gene_type:complete